MAISTTPPRLHPAYAEVQVTTDDATIEVSELRDPAQVGAEPVSVTLSRVPDPDGIRRFDLSGFLKTLFYDGRTAKPGTTMFYDDWALKARYAVTGDSVLPVHTAVNAAGQIDGSGSVYDVIAAGRPIRSYRPDSILPEYDGFPVGVTITRSATYDLVWDDAVVLHLRSDPGTGTAALYAALQGGIVDWGDGSAFETVDRSAPGEITHRYPVFGGTYQVKILASSATFDYSVATALARNSLYAVETAQAFATFVNFSNCRTLTSVPADVFSNTPDRKTFAWGFMNCSSLASIPPGLFASGTKVTTFASCFYQCLSLTSVPADLFATCTSAIDFSLCFYGCAQLTSLPGGLFSATAATTFTSCFQNTLRLTSLPDDLFAGATRARTFVQCFQGCSGLQSLPPGLFADTAAVTSMSSCFSGCAGLTEIPEDLFSALVACSDFNLCFSLCISLTSIPDQLFATCAKGRSFIRVFLGCRGLATVPGSLFAPTAGVAFTGCFENCASIATIGGDLFPATGQLFDQCFSQCTSLTAIPSDLFSASKGAFNFNGCFVQSTASTVTRGTTPVTAEGYRLWERAGKAGYPSSISHIACFKNRTGLSDYSDAVSAGWA